MDRAIPLKVFSSGALHLEPKLGISIHQGVDDGQEARDKQIKEGAGEYKDETPEH